QSPYWNRPASGEMSSSNDLSVWRASFRGITRSSMTDSLMGSLYPSSVLWQMESNIRWVLSGSREKEGALYREGRLVHLPHDLDEEPGGVRGFHRFDVRVFDPSRHAAEDALDGAPALGVHAA